MTTRKARWVRLALVLVSWSAVADAAPVKVSNFTACTSDAGTALDSWEFTEADGGGSDVSEDADVQVEFTEVFTAAAGGNASTKSALAVSLIANESRYYEYALPTPSPTVTIGEGLHVDTAPSVARIIGEFRMGSTRGCYYVLNTDRTISVFYNTSGTNFGTSTQALTTKNCATDVLTGCTADASCPTTCSSSCTTSTGAGCFWPGVEFSQSNYPSITGDQVTCELWVNGSLSVTGLLSAASLSNVTAWRFGGPASGENGTLAYYVGYFLHDDSTRAGFGWVGDAIPIADGATSQWLTSSCSARGYDPDTNCVVDWLNGGRYDTETLNNVVRVKVTAQTEDFLTTDVDPGSAAIKAVETVAVGRTSDSGTGTGTLRMSLLNCTSPSSCTAVDDPTPDTITYQSSSMALRGDFLSEVAPGGVAWTKSALTNLGIRMNDLTRPANTQLRIGALVVYVYGRKPDAPLPMTIPDNNVGVKACGVATDCCASGCLCEGGKCTKDGRRTVCAYSDSRGSGSLQSTCNGGDLNGQACSVPFYCNNVVNANGEVAKDIPAPGGCTTDAQCATCTLRRAEANGGAGYPCTADAGCADSTCDLTTNTCLQNDAIPCTVNGECTGLGTCQTDPNPGAEGDYCVASCPGGGTCPSRSGWPGFIADKVSADTIIGCSLGGEHLWQFVNNRFENMLIGRDALCSAAVGSGVCSCSSGSDCGAGGTCTGGLCVAGDATHLACASYDQCTGANVCVFDPCDEIVGLEDVNDAIDSTSSASECGPSAMAVGYGDPTGVCNGTTVLCTTDAACDTDLGGSVSPTSQCLGDLVASDAYPCVDDRTNQGTTFDHAIACTGTACLCSMKAPLCIWNPNCTGTGYASCLTSGDTATPDPWKGVCGCTTDAQCVDTAIWKCVGSKCRRKCTLDSQCSNPTRTGSCDAGGTGVCKGRCSTPSDRTTCSVDANCPNGTTLDLAGREHRYAATCSGSGRCQHGGPAIGCYTDAPTKAAALLWGQTFRNPKYNAVDQITKMQAILAARRVQDGASVSPTLIIGTTPEQGTSSCGLGWRDFEYIGNESQRLLGNPSLFPHVVDTRRLFAEMGSSAAPLFSFFVHFGTTAAQKVGNAFGDYLASINTCAKQAAGLWSPQKYCVTSAGVYATSGGTDGHGACVTAISCAAGSTCQPKPCTVGGDCPNTSDVCKTE